MNYVFISAFGEGKTCVRDPANRLLLQTALLVYDSILTLSQEVHYIWKKKFKIGTALYMLARYAMLVYIFLQVLGSFVNIPSLQVRFSDHFY